MPIRNSIINENNLQWEPKQTHSNKKFYHQQILTERTPKGYTSQRWNVIPDRKFEVKGERVNQESEKYRNETTDYIEH